MAKDPGTGADSLQNEVQGVLTGARIVTLDTLRKVLTEENTDRFLDLIFGTIRLPWWIPSAIARRVLDGILPEVLLGALERLLGAHDSTGTP